MDEKGNYRLEHLVKHMRDAGMPEEKIAAAEKVIKQEQRIQELERERDEIIRSSDRLMDEYEQRIRVLESALDPFAVASNHIPEDMPEDDDVIQMWLHLAFPHQITIADLRRAETALTFNLNDESEDEE